MTASERLAEQVRLGSNTAALVFDPSNMFYLTEGYTGEGLVFISENRRVIVTDFRYTEQAEKQAPAYFILGKRRRMPYHGNSDRQGRNTK